jgi:hypothetical protein
MIDPETEDLLAITWDMIREARAEREIFRQEIEESRTIVRRSREIIARLDQLLMSGGPPIS